MTQNNPGERIAGAVRAEMARARVSQTDMARHLGTSQAAMSRRLRGEVPFTVTDIVRIAERLGVTPIALAGFAPAA